MLKLRREKSSCILTLAITNTGEKMKGTLVVFSLLISFAVGANEVSQDELFICFKDKEQTIKLLDVSFDPVKDKRVGKLHHETIEDIHQVENSFYGDDFFIEPTGNSNQWHLSVKGVDQNAYCVGYLHTIDKDEASEDFNMGFASIGFR